MQQQSRARSFAPQVCRVSAGDERRAPTSGIEARPAPRVLFFAEAATLAHVGRASVLAQALHEQGYEVHLACAARCRWALAGADFTWHDLGSRSSASFRRALAKGQPIFDVSTLSEYVRQDMRLFETVAPDLVVGDLRLSLSVSARLAGIPYWNVTSAYWSPYARPVATVPELPITRALGPRLAQPLFELLYRPLSSLHARPLNRVRRQFGLPSLGRSVQRVYTDGDETLYADLPLLVPTSGRSASHRYLGPIIWSPQIALPAWWGELPQDRPLLYVTMGSSGDATVVPAILEAVADLPVSVALATAGKPLAATLPANVWSADFLPGEKAVARAALMVCSGSSASAYQALAGGVPLLGLPANLDQYSAMHYIQRAQVGSLVRSGTATARQVRAAISDLLGSATARSKALSISREIRRWNAPDRFRAFTAERLGRPTSADANRGGATPLSLDLGRAGAR